MTSLRLITMLAAALMVTAGVEAQNEDPILFSVEGKPVYRSEFVYIYEKTNGKNADYSRKSLQEYLDLYVKFKLKVQRAKDMKLDTIPSLQRELEGYRRQLADSYLVDKEITEKLTQEAFERAQQDVDISHVLIPAAPDAIPEDTLVAYQRAMDARNRLAKGEDFATVARELSADQSAATNGGHIGFVTALFPNGYYPLETAAYSLPAGKLSQPVRTTAGYHIILVNGRRPARGEIEAAHIMLRTKDKDPAEVKIRIDSIYQALQNGADFGELAKTLSQDGFTADKGGYIGFFGINRFEPSFEEAAFAISEDGTIGTPFQSSIGWHIIRRISRRGIQPYEIEKRRLEGMVKKDDRHAAARQAMIDRIKNEEGFAEQPVVLNQFMETLTEEFLTFRWKAPQEHAADELFRLGKNYVVTLGDFTEYLVDNSRRRSRLERNTTPESVARAMYADFVNENCMKYQESRLEEEYPEFRNLMREYEEGILLFEATQLEVWNKASQDSAGLVAFFERIKDKYRWDERAKISSYRLSATAGSRIAEVREYVEKKPAEDVLAHFNTADNIILSAEARTMEKTKNTLFIGVPWQVGAVSPTKENNQSLTFFKIEEIIPPVNKTLDEARGYVIAEYQDYLEQQWVKQLRNTYEVTINDKVLEAMMTKEEKRGEK